MSGGGSDAADAGIAHQQQAVIADRDAFARQQIAAVLGEQGYAIKTHGKIVGALAQRDIACRFRRVEKTADLIGQRLGIAAARGGAMILRGRR